MAAGEGPRDWQQGGAYRSSFSGSGSRLYPPSGRINPAPQFGWLALVLGLMAAVIAALNAQGLVWIGSMIGVGAVICGGVALRGVGERLVAGLALPIIGMVLGTVASIILISSFVASGATVRNYEAQHPLAGQQQSGPVDPSPVKFASAQDERAALLQSLPYIAGNLEQIAASGQPMPTSFDATPSGTLVAEPSGRVLGPLPAGCTLEWNADPTGRVTTLTLIGPTFGTRIPIDIGAIPLRPTGDAIT